MLPDDAARAVSRSLSVADRLVPGRICDFYMVGSIALEAWRPGISDIDLVAVVDGDLDEREMRRLALPHKPGNVPAAWQALAWGRFDVQ
ncbi:nucleotidyltransferase domain-containing protein [Sphaerisporangium dianthi]|uniref:Nucleotidyltransferase domain-containing protein n=1 Tax=Sphaerisporangium dianthi TaxID=1436120 RepID=A0ABV9CK40_9ACTN